MDTSKVLQLAMELGEILLTSGAEVYRVEETIRRVCKSYGIECDCFATLTGIFISTEGTSEDIHSLTTIRRIKDRSVDLHKIELVNAFSRSLETKQLSYSDAMKKMDEIKKRPYFSFPIMLLAASFNAFVYSCLFGGDAIDGAVAFLISMTIFSLKEYMAKYGFFEFLQLFLSGIIAGGMTLLFKNFIPELNIDKVIVGAIMVFVPGVAITSGIKDALNGDIVSSSGRIGEAILTACALGAGVGIMLVLGTKLL
ncbi:MAG: threonine/serine exporter family protein [Clostridium sp.]